MTVLTTKDYSIFKIKDNNRIIKEKKVQRMAAAIQTSNLLHILPILVNSNMEVIDGQHRLKAAERLGLEIPYRIVDMSDKEMLLINQNQDSWNEQDFISYYTKEGNVNYHLLTSISQELGVSISIFLCFCGFDPKNTSTLLKSGKLILPSTDEIQKIKEKIKCYKQYLSTILISNKSTQNKKMFCSYRFIQALAKTPDSVDFFKFMSNIYGLIENIPWQGGAKSYMLVFQSLGLYE